eukprot:scaffold101981_cov24-Cyclotella_meneghiniana.AAC.3
MTIFPAAVEIERTPRRLQKTCQRRCVNAPMQKDQQHSRQQGDSTMMFSGRMSCCILAIIISMPIYSYAFMSHARTTLSIIVPSPSTKTLMNTSPTIPVTTCLSSKNNNNNDNDDAAIKKRQYTRIEDGSPIGVAIVLLGTLELYLYYGRSLSSSTLMTNDSSSVWIVFATASIAAGLARLFRYVRDKE